ncbi:hypothetical protein DFH27DRAFT_604452 [Peziza echinospora]|nr:hypothetical protein DFH27DRAFT_604452 [Peziza echinospora]
MFWCGSTEISINESLPRYIIVLVGPGARGLQGQGITVIALADPANIDVAEALRTKVAEAVEAAELRQGNSSSGTRAAETVKAAEIRNNWAARKLFKLFKLCCGAIYAAEAVHAALPELSTLQTLSTTEAVFNVYAARALREALYL